MIEIRQAKAEDSYELSLMTGELLHEIMDKIDMQAFNFDQQQTEKRVRDLISKEKYFVFITFINNEPIGFISMYESYVERLLNSRCFFSL